MNSKEESFSGEKMAQLRRLRNLGVLFLLAVSAGHLALELGREGIGRSDSGFELLNWWCDGLTLLLGVVAIQFSFAKITKISARLATEHDNLIAVFEAAQVGMLLVDKRYRVVLVNRGIIQKFGYFSALTEGEHLGKILNCPNVKMAPQACGHTVRCEFCDLMGSLRRALGEGESIINQETLLSKSIDARNDEMWVHFSVEPLEIDGHRHALISLLDISERREAQQQLHTLAFFDPLTRLPNRAQFNKRLEQVIAENERNAKNLATGVMFLDLDGFKTVNDTLGHEVGDQLLRKVGKRLETCLRDYDMVARLGGDEFALILPDVRQAIDLAVVARKILAAIDAPFRIAGKELFITTSIGIACCPVDSREPGELLRFADAAMYHAKANGNNNYQFYSESMTRCARERLELEADLRKALQLNQLELYYQPKVDTLLGLLVGGEALLRWRHPVRGLVPPDQFIGIAEDTGLIVEIGAWVLESACRAAVEWNRTVLYPLKVAVNLSVRQFLSGQIVATVETVLAETGCRPEWLELEITESLLMAHRANIVESLEALSKMGVGIALDDFGTGYSSLSYLIQFPVSTLKIDRSFIRDITTATKNLELLKAIVSMGYALGLDLVAEGVETTDQAVCLDKIGCHVIQGYLYSKPLPLAEFNLWMAEFNQHRSQEGNERDGPETLMWRDYLTTGHALIDSQHQELFRRIACFSLACRSDQGRETVANLLEYLAEYVKTHFAAEEELLQSFDSAQYSSHKQAHDYFSGLLATLLARYRKEGGSLPLTLEVHCMSVDWLTRHICTMDRVLAADLQQVESAKASGRLDVETA